MSDREHPLLIEYSGITALEEKSPPLWLLHPIREKWNVHTFQRKMTSEDVALLASPHPVVRRCRRLVPHPLLNLVSATVDRGVGPDGPAQRTGVVLQG